MTCYNCINGIPGPGFDRNGDELQCEEPDCRESPSQWWLVSILLGLTVAVVGIAVLLG